MSKEIQSVESVVAELEPLLKWPSNQEGNEAVRKLTQTITQRDQAIKEALLERVEGERKNEVKWKKAKYDVKSVDAVCFNRALDDIKDIINQELK